VTLTLLLGFKPRTLSIYTKPLILIKARTEKKLNSSSKSLKQQKAAFYKTLFLRWNATMSSSCFGHRQVGFQTSIIYLNITCRQSCELVNAAQALYKFFHLYFGQPRREFASYCIMW